jgi:NADH dehydrogenase
MTQGDIVAHNIKASFSSGALKPYKYQHVGEIVTLGRTNAVGELYGIKFTGALAKLMKKVVHLWYLRSIGGFKLLLGL